MKKLTFSALLLVIGVSGIAQDRHFARTYQSLTLPRGARDLEVWSTYRTGREYFYKRLDTRVEFEMGLTDKLQTALYLNASHKAAGPHLDTLGGIPDTTSGGVSGGSEFSISSEWKWKLSDPVADKIGFALYGELSLSPVEVEIESKLIFDKKTEKNIWALNLVHELEFEHEVEKDGEVETELEEMALEMDLGFMRMIRPNLGLGFELRNHNEIVKSDWEHSALFGGPSFFHSGEKYFLILNILPQWANLLKTDEAPNSMVLNEHEKFEIRLLLGFGL